MGRRHERNLKIVRPFRCRAVRNIYCAHIYIAIEYLKQTGNANFDEAVELHANLNIDPKYADQQLRTTITLPYGNGNAVTVGVLTNKENFEEAKYADIVGDEDLLDQIRANNIKFDVLIATPNLMPKLAKLGSYLGPKGLMPSLKSGTVTNSDTLKTTIDEFKKGKFEYRADKTGIVHASFGKCSFDPYDLRLNLFALYKSIKENRPSGAKGEYFSSFFLCTSMGPSLKFDVDIFEKEMEVIAREIEREEEEGI